MSALAVSATRLPRGRVRGFYSAVLQVGRLRGGRVAWAVLWPASGGPPARRAVWGAAPDTPAMGIAPWNPKMM